ncbi:MAG: SDR family oxidoreductase [Bacteroidetes bacterium]|nr:SDR family oxidoreductase [Bacteroidota bacterium]
MNVILVTGGNRGIGQEICRQLDEAGYIVILGSRDLLKGEKAAGTMSERVIVKQLDVTDEESIQALFAFVKKEFGKLDILINNAGIGERSEDPVNEIVAKVKRSIASNFAGTWQMLKKMKPILHKTGIESRGKGAGNVSLFQVRKVMETNFYGAWRMIQVFVPLILKSEDGRIINISSGMGELSALTGFYPGYSLSKTSLNALTIMFSNELKEKGIKVNAVCPGWVRTDMGGVDAPLSVSEGADTAVWLATEMQIPTGKFFQKRSVINW